MGQGGCGTVTIYVDVLIALNLYVTWFLLLAAERLAGSTCPGWRRGLAALAGGKICDVTRTSVTVEFCDTTERVENFLSLCRPYGLKSVVRTGSVAMEKGGGSLSAENSGAKS